MAYAGVKRLRMIAECPQFRCWDKGISRPSADQTIGPAARASSGPFFVLDKSYAFAEVSAPRSAASFSVEKDSIKSPSFRSV